MDTFEILLTTHSRVGTKGKQAFIIDTTLLRSKELALVSLDYIGQEFWHGEKKINKRA